MKIVSAYKDASGFHYEVTLDEKNELAPHKLFNYGPVAEGEDEAEYTERIQKEIFSVCALFKELWARAGAPIAREQKDAAGNIDASKRDAPLMDLLNPKRDQVELRETLNAHGLEF